MPTRRSSGPLLGVILDWAGTTVDFGCRAPVEAFRATFRDRDVEITTSEARAPMGLNKRDHLRAITRMARVAAAWKERHGRPPDESDVDSMYEAFLPIQLGCIREHADLIDGTLDAIAAFRARGLKIGTTTGYSRAMIDVLLPLAERQGYRPDAVACASDAAHGRPAPDLVWLNAMTLGLYPLSRAIKIGDTVADIDEGRNAGMWTIALAKCGNEVGLSRDEAAALPARELTARVSAAKRKLGAAGAHYVVESIADTISLIDIIETRLAAGDRP
ncbi:MAG TPA: phosphonoacetaldehyde hydrolase [Gemmatimonadaceae bacterium]|nr:phosphonoacetaldehyde hydrolase [Gemmatimonadaceae bacterium]